MTNVAVVNSGMIFTLAVPFASGSTALNLHRATPVPMPNGGEDGYASQYEMESNYIAIAESTNRIALLSQQQIDNCLGSSSFPVCINGFSLETAENTCLGSLLIGNQFSALQNCNILTVKLPIKEKAKNLGNGKWLITSSCKNVDLFLSDLKNTDHLKRTKLPGCQVCVLELKCGTKIETSSMELRADMFSCKNDSAIKIDIKIADPLQHLFSKLPDLAELPHISSMSEARRQIVEQVQLKMLTVPEFHRKSLDKLDEISEPIILKMKNLRPGIQNKFREAGTWKMSVTIGFCSFCISLLLHFGLTYVLQCYRQRYAKVLTSVVGEKRIKSKPMLVVSATDYQYLQLHPMSKLANNNNVLSEQQLMQHFNLTNQASAPADMDNMQLVCKQIARNLNTPF